VAAGAKEEMRMWHACLSLHAAAATLDLKEKSQGGSIENRKARVLEHQDEQHVKRSLP
jgi:hypothetical protein